MSSTDELAVYLHEIFTGHLLRRGNRTTFSLADSYRARPRRPVLGQVFEEAPGHEFVGHQGLPAWFANLLPEPGPLRAFLVSSLQIRDNDFALLAALGSDLPGAVTVRQASQESAPRNRVRQVAVERTHAGGIDSGVRFSMAGVQLKLSMIAERNTVRLAGADEHGDVLVKFPAREPDLPLNEFTLMTLASRCGITVPDIGLIALAEIADLPPAFRDSDGHFAYWIRRFDRTAWGPIHIEDFNQILNQPVSEKYRGASEEAVARIVLNICGQDDFWEFVRRLVFNIAMGNEDAHLKNLSIWYPDQLTARLSPFYDAVSTIVIPGLTREHGLRLGGTRRAATFSLAVIRGVAEKAGMDPVHAEQEASSVLDQVRCHEPEVRAAVGLPAAYWDRLDHYRRSVPLLRPLT